MDKITIYDEDVLLTMEAHNQGKCVRPSKGDIALAKMGLKPWPSGCDLCNEWAFFN